MLGAAGEPALLHNLPPAARHGLPAAPAHAAPGERPAPVPAAAQHPHGHVSGERGPGGPGDVSSGVEGAPERGAGSGRGRGGRG